MAKNKWNEQFQQNKHTYGKIANEFITSKSDIFPASSKIACFAEGEGRNAVHLAKLGHTVTAYDLSTVGLEHATLLARENGVSIDTVEADLIQTAVEKEAYDGAIMVFGHVPSESHMQFLTNMIQSVKPGGYFMFEVYSKQQIDYGTGGPGIVDMLYDPKEILDIIQPYKCLHFYYGEANRMEGYRHTGVGHVIQVLIQK